MIICLIAAAGVGFGYFWVYRLLRDTVGDEHARMAYVLADLFSERIRGEYEKVNTLITNPGFRDVVTRQNLKHDKVDPSVLLSVFQYTDQQWRILPAKDPLIRAHLDNVLGHELRAIVNSNEHIAEIYITDRFGALVAASGKTTDYYQADEEWWQKTFHNGEGRDFIGNIEFDESAGVMVILIALPIRNEDHKLIGICGFEMDLIQFFTPIKEFKTGKTGGAFVIENTGHILFHPQIHPASAVGTDPLSVRYRSPEEFQELLHRKKKWGMVSGHKLDVEGGFQAFAQVHNDLLKNNGMEWLVFINEDVDEVFAPLRELSFQWGMMMIVFTIVVIYFGSLIDRSFAKPIKKLHEATQIIGSGNLDYRVEMDTGDEIEELGRSLNTMSHNLKTTTTSIDHLNREIAVREEVEAALRLFRSLIDKSNDGIFVMEPENSRFLDVNLKACQSLGYTREELMKMGVVDIEVLIDDLAVWRKHVEEVREKGFVFLEGVHKRKDGSKFPVEVNVNYLKVADKAYMVAVVRDITERKNFEVLKESLMHMVVHDLNNPLMILSLNLEFLEESFRDSLSTEQRDQLRLSLSKCQELSRMISDLLDISKMEEGKFKLRYEQVLIDTLIKEVVDPLDTIARLEHKNVLVQVSADMPVVAADHDILKRILENLMGNALKVTPSNGHIEVAARYNKEEGNVLLYVKDDGFGIPRQYHEKIFEKFAQVEEGQIKGKIGKGLGLTFCKMAVEAHGGRIWVESEVGKGSSFYFQIPVSAN
jgi:PAS domain S-box-containing protein